MISVVNIVILCTLGALSILAGINHWKFPSIFGYLRKTLYGEILNSIVWICVGIVLIIVAVTV